MRTAFAMLLAVAVGGSCCHPRSPNQPSKLSADPTTIRTLSSLLVSDLKHPAFVGCTAEVGEHYDLVDERGPIARARVDELSVCGQCGCDRLAYLMPVIPPTRATVGKVLVFGPVQDDFPLAKAVPIERATSERPPVDPNLGWTLLALVDLDSDGQGDLFWFGGTCGTGGGRLCQLTELRASDGWYVLDSYLAEDAPPRMKVAILVGSVRVSATYLSNAVDRFKAAFVAKTTGGLNEQVKWPSEVAAMFRVLASNYEVAPAAGSGGTISRDSIRQELASWYAALSANEQYRFLYLLNDMGLLRIAADLAASLRKPAGMGELPRSP